MRFRHFEDFEPGQEFIAGPVTVTREAMIAFAKEFDPQAFHLDEAAARATFVGRLIGSGWQTAAYGMRLLAEGLIVNASSMGSPGIDSLRWLRPVLPGDALRASIRVEETRASASRPDRGFVRFTLSLSNQSGEPVMDQRFGAFFARTGERPAPREVVPDTGANAPPEGTDAVLLPFLGEAVIGTQRDLGRHLFEAEAIVAFARAYDPQVFHLDAEAAARSHFGALCASGWHTAAVWMKRLHATRARDIALTTQSGPVPKLGPSPGFRDMRWLRPVYAGDTLRFASRLVDKRESASRLGWGLATHHNVAENQRGEPVFEFTGSVFWQWAAP